MPLKSLAVSLPLNCQTITSHPALQFFAIYGQKFPKSPEQFHTQPYDEFYAEDCHFYKTDNSVIEGGRATWEHLRKLYADFPSPQREAVSMIVVSDDENETHSIHTQFLTKLPADGGTRTVELPQAFVHVLGKADSGKGTLGMQIRELRNYYDLGIWERAAESNK